MSEYKDNCACHFDYNYLATGSPSMGHNLRTTRRHPATQSEALVINERIALDRLTAMILSAENLRGTVLEIEAKSYRFLFSLEEKP